MTGCAPIKATNLTGANVNAVRQLMVDEIADGVVTVTATTATFRGEAPLELIENAIERGRAQHGGRGPPVASLHAVRRKVATALAD